MDKKTDKIKKRQPGYKKLPKAVQAVVEDLSYLFVRDNVDFSLMLKPGKTMQDIRQKSKQVIRVIEKQKTKLKYTPVRNQWCEHYNQCLKHYSIINVSFCCSGCVMEGNLEGKKQLKAEVSQNGCKS